MTTQISPLAQQLTKQITQALPGAIVSIDDPDGAHLSAVVVSAAFAGLSRLQQHKLVYAALQNADGHSDFATKLHALQLTTRTP